MVRQESPSPDSCVRIWSQTEPVRSGSEEIGSREEDVQLIYQTNNWEDTKGLLDYYNVRYIFIGPIERRTYRVSESKFIRFLGEPVFESGQVSIYEVPREINPIESN